jgi:hypothetical protein
MFFPGRPLIGDPELRNWAFRFEKIEKNRQRKTIRAGLSQLFWKMSEKTGLHTRH